MNGTTTLDYSETETGAEHTVPTPDYSDSACCYLKVESHVRDQIKQLGQLISKSTGLKQWDAENLGVTLCLQMSLNRPEFLAGNRGGQ